MLLLIAKNIVQSPNLRQNLHGKLVALLKRLPRLSRKANPRRRARQDHRADGQRRSLRQEADQLGHAEDQITGTSAQRISQPKAVLKPWILTGYHILEQRARS